VSAARAFVWHDHRLSPPPIRPGSLGRAEIPVAVDGRPAEVTVLFARVRPPLLWPWLAGAAGVVAAIVALAARPAFRGGLTVALALVGGAAAVIASTTFAVENQPSGRVGWLQIGAALALGAAFLVLLGRAGARRRAHAAGIAGAVAAAATISSLPVFWHGVIVSALPGALARLACGLALVCGTAAATLSFLPDFEEPRPVAG
jgi:hypothetical protein